MPTYKITPRALNDLKNIAHYTENNWGRTQKNTYLKNLESRFVWLAENPQLGKLRHDICEGYYSFPEGQHVVFYLIDSRVIHIIGIPHKDMDIISFFRLD